MAIYLLRVVVLIFVLLAGVDSYTTASTSSAPTPTPATTTPNMAVRLRDGYSYSGRVEIYSRGSWKTVCDRSIGHEEIKVICRQLGYYRGDSYGAIYYNAHYGRGYGDIIESISCNGYESSLSACYVYDSYTSTGDCSNHYHDVGLNCHEYRNDYTTETITRKTTVTPNMRTKSTYPWWRTTLPYANVVLVGGSSSYEGRVEVYAQGSWKTVCDRSFSHAEVNVICRQVGHFDGDSRGAIYPYHYYGRGYGDIIESISCSGYESSLSRCSIYDSYTSTGQCDHYHDVGINCHASRYDFTTEATSISTQPNYRDVRLVDGYGGYSGRVEVYSGGSWKTVCGRSFSHDEVKVICRQVGHFYGDGRGEIKRNLHFGRGYGDIIESISCSGYESSLSGCSIYDSYTSTGQCDHYHDVGIDCLDYWYDYTTEPETTTRTSSTVTPIRLVDGNDTMSGRVEVYYQGQWGTICDDSFDNSDAKVVCRMLGLPHSYSDVAVFSSAYFGEGHGRITLDDLDCNGYESDISSCPSRGWLSHNCGHGEDVGVRCGQTPVRLVGGFNSFSGRVEVFYNGRWGTVCDDSFDRQDALVICKMLSLTDGYSNVVALNSAYFGRGNGPITIDELNCLGHESDIADCRSEEWLQHDCSHGEDAGVNCRAHQKTTPYWNYFTTEPYGYSLSRAIDVSCDESGWNINVDMNQVRQVYPYAVASDIYLGENSCTGSLTYYHTLNFRQGLRQCLTSEIVRSDVLVYSNELVYAMHDPAHPFRILNYNWTIAVECDVNKNATSNGHLHHIGHSVTAGPPVVGISQYDVNMTFYSDPNFLYEIRGNPLQVNVGSHVYVKVFSTMSDWTVKMIVHSCYTKPTAYAPDHLKYYIIKNGCEVDSNTHYISQSSHETRFVFQDFEYTTSHEGIELKCEASFCGANDYTPACSQTCNPVAKRSAVADEP